MGSLDVYPNSSTNPLFPRPRGGWLSLAILLCSQPAKERKAVRAAGKRLQPYKLTQLFIILLSAIA